MTITPFAFGADRVDNVDTILAADINNLRAWLAYTAALGRNANTETLAANKTLVDSDEPIQFLDPSVTEYTVELPAEGNANHVFYFVNTSASYDLEILDDAAATIVTIEPEKAAIVMSDGTDWKLIASTNTQSDPPATQITETSGPTTLDIGAIADGEHLLRDGTDLVGKTPYEYQNGGWIEVPDGSWSYASATTITVPSGAASIYAVGDQIRLKQGGEYKYYSVIAVADTLLTVTGGSDYTVANAAITDAAFSKGGMVGHPFWFDFDADPQPTGSMTLSSVSLNVCKFCVESRKVSLKVKITATPGGSLNSKIYITAPIPRADLNAYLNETVGPLYESGTGTTLDILAQWESTSPTNINFNRIGNGYNNVSTQWSIQLYYEI